ncbi:MAG: ThiF family adenylyltransferase [Jatrophihabitantaceae bacterium]
MLEPLTPAFVAHDWIAGAELQAALGPVRSSVAVRALSGHQLLQWTDRPATMPPVEGYATAALLAVPPRELSAHRVAVVGCGGIGGEVARHLGANGIRQLLLVDDDAVSRTNLNRQYLYTRADEGRPKVAAAGAALRAVDPDLQVTTLEVSIRNEAGTAVLDPFGPTVVLCCADTPQDVGRLLSDYATECGAVFAIASAGLDEVSWGPVVLPGGPSYSTWSQSLRVPAGVGGEPLAYSFGPTNSLVAALLARDLIHVLLGEAAPSLGAQLTWNLRTLQITRRELVPG